MQEAHHADLQGTDQAVASNRLSTCADKSLRMKSFQHRPAERQSLNPTRTSSLVHMQFGCCAPLCRKQSATVLHGHQARLVSNSGDRTHANSLPTLARTAVYLQPPAHFLRVLHRHAPPLPQRDGLLQGSQGGSQGRLPSLLASFDHPGSTCAGAVDFQHLERYGVTVAFAEPIHPHTCETT